MKNNVKLTKVGKNQWKVVRLVKVAQVVWKLGSLTKFGKNAFSAGQ